MSSKIDPRFFSLQFFVGWRTQKFVMAVCYRGLPLPCGKVWLSSITALHVQTLAMKKNAEFLEGE